MIYKFVELSVVTAESLEEAVNEWVGEGWQLEGIRFVTGDGSRRPQMAFVSFVREEEADAAEPPARSVMRRREKIVDLGEIDPGEIEPFEADLDWANARRRRRAATPTTPAKTKTKKRTR